MTIQNRIAELTQLRDATNNIDCDSCRCSDSNSACEGCLCEIDRLDDEIEALIEQLRDSDEPRQWEVWDDGGSGCYDSIEATSATEALDEACGSLYLHDGWESYDDNGNSYLRTVYLTISVICRLTEEEDSREVVLEPDEPNCTEDEHDWIESVDWLDSRDRVCRHCGCIERTESGTDNCGINRDYTSYRSGDYDEQIKRLKLQHAVDTIDESDILDDGDYSITLDQYNDCRVNLVEGFELDRAEEITEKISLLLGRNYSAFYWMDERYIEIELV